jgi:Asp-tRNA(Asn)/Glu-tRNA(Gln) amidotransferase A subunit family amidase
VEVLREAGARIVEIDLAWPQRAVRSSDLFLAEGAAALADVYPSRRDELGDDLLDDLDRAGELDAVSLAVAARRRLEYAARLAELVARSGVDLIATPTLAFPPPPVGTRRVAFAGRDSADVGWAMCGLTEIFNVLGWPAISVPCGRDALGLPAGLQLAALPWRESLCLAGAAVVESTLSQPALAAR